jgi:monoamine oxidase
MNDKLHFAGTESATEFSGYMEGAIISALNIAGIFK